MPLMKISEFQEAFTPASRPDQRTVVAWIRNGQLYGEKRGRAWYVDPQRPTQLATQPTPASSNKKLSPLAQKILARAAG